MSSMYTWYASRPWWLATDSSTKANSPICAMLRPTASAVRSG